jgi:CubicO group peptidase (beta-lactamase class C family)
MRLPAKGGGVLLAFLSCALAGSVRADALDEVALRSLGDRKVPGASLAIMRQGGISGVRTYGTLKAGGVERVNAETLFQAASISKPVTAMAVLRLVQDQRLGLDQDVNEILRSWKLPENRFTGSKKVTVRGILSHTAGVTVSGFPGYRNGDPLPSLIQILSGAPPANTPPIVVDVEPGSLSRYSGGGYTILHLLVVEQTGRSFPDALKAMVFEPLEMTRSTFEQPLPERLSGNVAQGHDRAGVTVDGSWHVYPELAPDGLWTTPRDLARFALEVGKSLRGESNRVLDQEPARLMVTRQLAGADRGFGLGFEVNGSGESFRFRFDGSNRGYRCRLVFYPDAGEGAVIMTNGGRGDEVIVDLMRQLRSDYKWPL